ncbi:hypothetical protein BJ741DRAFT_629598 [Chytriomyces cf. hyalinus JEL632]|nr:hypothetical protein BJ741DRAFT_629598 [Chytriomyces cf. hyalinus JEL632]
MSNTRLPVPKSDSNLKQAPQIESGTLEKPGSTRYESFLDKCSAELLAWHQKTQPFVHYHGKAKLATLPEGYFLVHVPRVHQKSGDSYLYGHPSGRKFRSAVKFAVHLLYLAGDARGTCSCELCSGRNRDSDRRSNASSAEMHGEDFRSGAGSSKRAKPDVHFAQSDTTVPKSRIKRNASSASSRPNSADNSGQISWHASPRSSKPSLALSNTPYFEGATGSAANGSSRLKSYQRSINLNQRSHHSEKYNTSQIHLGMESNSRHHQQPEQFTKIYESVPRKAKILPPEPDDSQFLHREHAEDVFQVVDDSASSRSSSRDRRTRYGNDKPQEQPSPVGSNSEWAEELVDEGSTQPPAQYPANEVVDLTIGASSPDRESKKTFETKKRPFTDLSAPVETQSNPKKLFNIIALNKPLTSICSEANRTKRSVDGFALEKPRSRFSEPDRETSTIADVLIDLTDFSESFNEVPSKTQLSGVNDRPSAQKDVRPDSASNRSASKRVDMMKSYDAFTDGFDESEASANKNLNDQQPRRNDAPRNKEKPQRNDQESPEYAPSAQRQRLNSLSSEGITTNKRRAPLARKSAKEEIAPPYSSHPSANETGSTSRPHNTASKVSNFESESRHGSDLSNVNLREGAIEPQEKTIPVWERRQPSILKERPPQHPELTKKKATPHESHNASQSSPQQIQKPLPARGTSFKRENYFFKPTLHAYDLCWIRVFAITNKPYFGGNKLGQPIHWPCIVRRVLKEYSRLSSTPNAVQSPTDDGIIRAFRGNTLWVNERDDASVRITGEDAGRYMKVKPSVPAQVVALYEIELLGLDDACGILVEGRMLEAYLQLKVMGPFPQNYSFVIPSVRECLIVKYIRGLRHAFGVSQSRLNVIGLQKKAAMMATQVPKMPFREATGDNLLINLKDKSWFGVLCGAEMIHCGDIVRVKTESCVVTDVFTAKKGARVEDLMLDSSICGYGCGGWVLPDGEMLMEVVRVEFKEGDVQSLKLFGYLCYLDRVATGDDGAAKFQVKRGWFLKNDDPADGTNRTGQSSSCVQFITVPCVGGVVGKLSGRPRAAGQGSILPVDGTCLTVGIGLDWSCVG